MLNVNFFSNKGMYIEKLIEHSIIFFNSNNIAHLEKRYLPIQIRSVRKDYVEGYLLKKSYSDFFGIYKGKFIDFEAKQTNKDFFDINLIKKHQLDHLIKIKQLNGCSFLIIHFFTSNETFFVDIAFIEKQLKLKKKKITINLFKKYCNLIELEFPGIINFLKFIN